jgi:hypothetical protein
MFLFIVAAHVVEIIMTEVMIEAMMIETTTADHTGKLHGRVNCNTFIKSFSAG